MLITLNGQKVKQADWKFLNLQQEICIGKKLGDTVKKILKLQSKINYIF